MFFRLLAAAFAVLSLAALHASAQDIDSVISSKNRNPATIADQISDPTERAAFLDLYRHTAPHEMLAKSQAFLEKFTQSAFLAQAYEVAARSCFDFGRFTEGLHYAEESLKLLPENPLLLVSVADVQSHQRINDLAIANGRLAIEYLDRFSRAATVQEKDWPALKSKLKASAYFAVGRALLAEAADSTNKQKQTKLATDSVVALTQARGFNPDDPEITYLLGLAQLTSGNFTAAASNLAEVYRRGGDLAPKALDNLKAIYKTRPSANPPQSENGFDAFLAAIKAPPEPAARPSAETSPPGPVSSDYAGSEACRSCHGGIYRAWSQSGMSKMFRPYAPENVIGDFTKHNEYFAGDEQLYRDGQLKIIPGKNRVLYAKMTIRDGRHFFSIRQSDGQWHTYPVDYTIGSKWQQAYATRVPNGDIKIFPIQYNVAAKQWVNFWKIIDDPGSARADLTRWDESNPAAVYQTNCAVCHTSQLRDLNGGDPTSTHREFREPGIDCEMCHGPSAQHIDAMNSGDTYEKKALDPPVNFAQATNREFISVCSQCHMQSALRVPGPHGEINYSRTGDFFMHYQSIPFDEFSRKGFYKDGRFRQTTFIVESLERSQCFLKGQITCGTCHDPHTHDEATNLTALKFRDNPDRMCTGCHTQFGDKSAASVHSHHPPDSEGSRCVSCHMPKIMDGLLSLARTHTIDDIPNVEMTRRLGQESSPNACLLCHTGKNVDWLQAQMRQWNPAESQKQAGGTP